MSYGLVTKHTDSSNYILIAPVYDKLMHMFKWCATTYFGAKFSFSYLFLRA